LVKPKRIAGWLFAIVGIVLLAWGAATWLRAPGGGTSVKSRAGDNLLLITLDTTRADHIGCYGGDERVTPNIDRLAENGVVFEQVTATAPITLPSHTSMLTGLDPIHHGVRNNGMFTLPEDRQTLAHMLRDRGYATAAFVSASVLATRYGLDAGFDTYDDDLSRGRSMGAHAVPERRGDLTVAAALEWLESVPESRPFFCWIHLYDPHAPYDPPVAFRRRFPDDPYTAEIAFADSLVGRVLEALDASGRLSRTVVSLASDHGEGLGEHGENTHAILLHQATLRVPWIISSTRMPHGTRISIPVSGSDVAPTLAGLVGVKAPNRRQSDGVSAIPLIERPSTAPTGRRLLAETLLPHYQYGWQPLYAVRVDNWQLISGRRQELFDLGRDPRELSDLSSAEPTVLADLTRELEEILEQAPDQDSANARLSLSRSEIDKLQALGYLGAEAAARPEPPDPRDLIGAHVHMERARNLSSRGNSVEAIAQLDRMLAQDPGNVSGLTMRAQLLVGLERYDEAEQNLAQCIAIDPDNAQAYAIMTRLEMARGRPERALELAEIGAGTRGAFETLYVLQAAALERLGRGDEASRLLDQRLELHPDDADLLTARAEIHLRAGETDSAEELLRRAVDGDALHLGSAVTLANLLESQGRIDEASAVLEGLLRVDPGHPVALAALGRVRLDDPERARPILEEAVRLNPTRFEPLASLGMCYLRLEMPHRAEATLRRALELRPNDLRASNNLAVSLFLQSRPEEAAELLRQLMRRAPEFAEAHNNLALVLHAEGRDVEAEQAAREALRLQPGYRDSTLTLAAILHDSGRHQEAADRLRELVQDNPDDLQAAARCGVALEAAGDCAEAAPLLERGLEVYPNEPELLISAARCADRLGEKSRAVRFYERAAQVSPEGPLREESQAAIERLATAGTLGSKP
jgi:arylsulfatase A-like enzyme/Flp pilus assembly protein TadD